MNRPAEISQLEKTLSDVVTQFTAMDAGEARRAADSIRNHLESARKLILDLYDREGWRALGYASWRECVTAEFEQSQASLYRQLEAARIERDISPAGIPGPIPTAHLTPLAALPESDRKAAWDRAVETAPDGRLTARHVREAVEEVRPRRDPVASPPGPRNHDAVDAGIAAVAEEPADVRKMRAAGIIPEGVAVEVHDPFNGDGKPEDEPDDALAELNDREYLERCPAREGLSDYCRTLFDRDALLYRSMEPAREKFLYHAQRALAKNRRAGQTGKYHSRLSGFLKLKHPRHWVVCADCKGTAKFNMLNGCPTCRDMGYHI